ncbi:MAG: nucleotidyltransferase [Vicinamibacteria bacterium]|jgi:hypothetical protein|nr:nucleotidyltransferase [Vicinamibacteria bacterium]
MLNELRPLFARLHSHQVDYLVIAGVATIAYGVPRLTLDLDLLIRPTHENTTALLSAFVDAGMATALLTSPEDLLAHEITVFKDRVRVDVQTRTPGIVFNEAFARRNTVSLDGVPVHLASRDDLIASKLASGRPKDLEDVKILEAKQDDSRS